MSTIKTIGIDARFLLRPLRGIPLYVLRLCQYLPSVNTNHKFVYFINKGFEHNDNPKNYLPRIEEIEKNNPNACFVNYNDEAEIKWEQVYLPRLIKEHNIDLLHMPANRISFFSSVPTIVTVHDIMEYLYLLDQKYPISWSKTRSLRLWQYNLRRRLYAVYNYRFGFKKSSKIITVSNSSAADIIQGLSIKNESLAVIHHGVDNDYLGEVPRPIEKRTCTLLLGGDSFQKNPEGAIACWSKVDSVLRTKFPLKVIGFCGSSTSPLMQAIKKYGLEDSVDIHGWVSQEEMVSCFKNAALFLFPSRYEGFGFPLIQAMASGTPIISTNKTSIPEVLGDVGFQYDPEDHAGMALGVEKILSSEEEWQKQSDAGYLRADKFKWEVSAQKHLSLYEEFL